MVRPTVRQPQMQLMLDVNALQPLDDDTVNNEILGERNAQLQQVGMDLRELQVPTTAQKPKKTKTKFRRS